MLPKTHKHDLLYNVTLIGKMPCDYDNTEVADEDEDVADEDVNVEFIR